MTYDSEGVPKRTYPSKIREGSVTVTVYRFTPKEQAPYFYVSGHVSGERRLESNSDENTTVQRTRQLARQIANGKITAAGMGAREAASYGRALQLLKPIGDSSESAADRYTQAVELLGSGSLLMDAVRFFRTHNPDQLAAISVPDMVAEFLNVRSPKLKKSTIKNYRNRLGEFAAVFRNQAHQVTTAEGVAELYIDRGDSSEKKEVFDRLLKQKEEIEGVFGGSMSWERLDSRRACRIKHIVEYGGYRSPEPDWPMIQAQMVDSMTRLESAIKPALDSLSL